MSGTVRIGVERVEGFMLDVPAHLDGEHLKAWVQARLDEHYCSNIDLCPYVITRYYDVAGEEIQLT
jgi:hypothetical protein